jgi:hypothetical protein
MYRGGGEKEKKRKKRKEREREREREMRAKGDKGEMLVFFLFEKNETCSPLLTEERE